MKEHADILEFEVLLEHYGKRLDQVIAEFLPDYSRSRLQQWIRDGLVSVNGQVVKPKEKLKGGEIIRFDLESALEDLEEGPWHAQEIALDIVYEDEHIIVVNKPAGLVVHPGAGNPAGTLVNALLHHEPGLATLPRAGIIHRLDKETSGLLVVARSLPAHRFLVDELQERNFEREYRAVVTGVMTAGGTVDAPIGRHPTQRTRMAVVPQGKPAITHYRVERKFRAHTYVRVNLETGRTHQIRVHMAHIRYPIVGDPVYGGRLQIPAGASEAFANCLREFRRQALHAAALGIVHPASGQMMRWEAALPQDMQTLLEAMEADRREHAERE